MGGAASVPKDELAKPADGSDITTLEEAKAEIARLRKMFREASGGAEVAAVCGVWQAASGGGPYAMVVLPAGGSQVTVLMQGLTLEGKVENGTLSFTVVEGGKTTFTMAPQGEGAKRKLTGMWKDQGESMSVEYPWLGKLHAPLAEGAKANLTGMWWGAAFSDPLKLKHEGTEVTGTATLRSGDDATLKGTVDVRDEVGVLSFTATDSRDGEAIGGGGQEATLSADGLCLSGFDMGDGDTTFWRLA